MEKSKLSKRVIYEYEGNLVVLTPAPNSRWTFAEICEKDIPVDPGTGEKVSFSIIEHKEIPKDREFRNAWKKSGKKIGVDMPKARVLHMNVIREARNEALDEIDRDINKMDDAGEDVTEMKKHRQVLRDIPQTFNLETAKTAKALSAKFPKELTRKVKDGNQ